MALILIVEDNASIAKIWSLKLSKEGFEVDNAKTGKEALDKVREKLPSLILMDIMIPGITGIEVFQQLRQNVEFAGIPVVFLSSSSITREEVQKLLDMGAAAYFQKFDISPQDLVSKVRALLEK